MFAQLEKEESKTTGGEQQSTVNGAEGDEEILPEDLATGATQARDSTILEDFMNGASWQVTERNGDQFYPAISTMTRSS